MKKAIRTLACARGSEGVSGFRGSYRDRKGAIRQNGFFTVPYSKGTILIYSAKDSHIYMSEFRLGDVIDDHCIKCRRITNHSIVSIVALTPAKVRCRTCYHDHDFRNGEAPPSKKDLKKAELFKEVLAAAVPGAGGRGCD